MEKQDYEIVIKAQARLDVFNQYQYLFENSSERFAEKFLTGFVNHVETILPFVWGYPECRFLPTKNHIYCNIVWGNYLIVYKILKREIWVVGLFHTKQNPSKLKSYRKVK
jgi:hypothetical protein